MRGSCGRREFVVCCLVVSGRLFWPSSGSGVLLLLGVEVVSSDRERGVWVRDGWGLGGVLELVWEGCQGQAPRCSSLEVSKRCRLPHRMVGLRVVPRRVGVWWGILVRLGWRAGGVCPEPVVCLLAKWHVRVSKQSCKQANRLILWGVGGEPQKKNWIFFYFFFPKNLENMI